MKISLAGLPGMFVMVAPACVLAETAAKPTLKVETLDGKTFDLAEKRGQWVVVNYWACLLYTSRCV